MEFLDPGEWPEAQQPLVRALNVVALAAGAGLLAPSSGFRSCALGQGVVEITVTPDAAPARSVLHELLAPYDYAITVEDGPL